MRLLTFNWHEPYICTLAKTGHQFDVVERLKAGSRAWFYETRPLPSNVAIVSEATSRSRLRAGDYDAVICHHGGDLGEIRDFDTPAVLIFHNGLTCEIALGGQQVDPVAHRARLTEIVERSVAPIRFVFVSEMKRADWGLPGQVVLPGIDLADYGGYAGHDARVLRIGNFMRSRNVMLGLSAQLAILRDLPSTLLGLNDPGDGGRFTTSWDDLRSCLRSHRVFLNTTVDGFEDGYNLAMLEAMATGMPVVSTPNRSSPIVDGEDGFVSGDLGRLHDQLSFLLANPDRARELGAQSRRTVAERFSIRAFVDAWNGILERTASDRRVSRPERRRPHVTRSPGASPGPLRILLASAPSPATPAWHLEKSLRRRHDVRAVGPELPAPLGDGPPARDAICGGEFDARALVDATASSWRPDLFLWIESTGRLTPTGVERLDCPTACYLLHSDERLRQQLEWGRSYDYVFVERREFIPWFVEAGCQAVKWLPLAGDPGIRSVADARSACTVGVIGGPSDGGTRRASLLGRLKARFDVHLEGDPAREASPCPPSRLVVNLAEGDEVGGSLFDALASGCCVLSSRAPGSWLEEMFADRQHLVFYDDDSLEALVEFYLSHDDERARIAAMGRREVMRWHTYDHRAADVVATVRGAVRDLDLGPAALGLAQDALVIDGVELAGRGEWRRAIDRLRLAPVQRDLNEAERILATNTAAACMAALGQDAAASRLWCATARALSSSARDQLLWAR
jgi:glycosyltransferase involved in cell wall biosynthesis